MLLMVLSLIVQLVSVRNNCDITSLDIKLLLCEMLSLAQKSFNLDKSSKFTFEIIDR